MMPRGCTPLLLLAAVLFVAAPLDAQLVAVAATRWLWLEPLGRAILAGLVAGLFGTMLGYSMIWNALSYDIYRAEERKAREAHERRKR